MSREFDVVVFGASSITGRRCGAFLRDAGANWAAAGRSATRVAEMLRQAEGVVAPTVLEADVSDPASLRALAARTKVLLNLVGPYAKHGEPVIAACVETGTHYVDLTGEIPFVARMIAAWDARARAAGVKVVQVCGFEALPADLGVALALDALPGTPASVDVEVAVLAGPPGRPRLSDALSGGTIQSMAEMIGDPDAGRLTDPSILLPAHDVERPALVRAASPIGLLPARRNGHLAAPMAPAPFINPPVIHRTAALAGAPVFRYREGMDTGLPGPLAMLALAPLGAVNLGFAGVTKLSPRVRTPLGRGLARVLPGSGFGPADDRVADWRWRLTVDARSATAEHVHVTADGEGHPGYLATSRMLAMTGVLLAEDGTTPQVSGHLTPAAALGTACAARFAAAGLTFAAA